MAMFLSGVEFLKSLTSQAGFSAKMVFNEDGALFFASNLQHRDQKGPQISYEDNYAGNALAAMLAPGRIEIRYHQRFTDRQVAKIIETLLAEPPLGFMRGWEVTYQGRRLDIMA